MSPGQSAITLKHITGPLVPPPSAAYPSSGAPLPENETEQFVGIVVDGPEATHVVQTLHGSVTRPFLWGFMAIGAPSMAVT
jgi:hypothetical protein